jgi:anti-anti-sigma regulatory factor
MPTTGTGFTVTVTASDAIRAELDVSGDLDMAGAQALTAAALEHELDHGRRFVWLDVAGLTFLDSAGIDALIETQLLVDER